MRIYNPDGIGILTSPSRLRDSNRQGGIVIIMAYPEFPFLRADQIEVKVKKVTQKGAFALIYKTARTDMDMLDSIVGPTNWQNSYRDIDGVMYCSISIRDPETGQWISKEDCGIESRSDGEGNEKKGEASDAWAVSHRHRVRNNKCFSYIC